MAEMPDIVRSGVEAAAKGGADVIDAEMPAHLRTHRVGMRGFERRLARVWGPGFDRLKVLIEVFIDMGRHYRDRHLVPGAKESPVAALPFALVQLHARAARVAYEVLALVRAGFADGAMARARTVAEIAIVAVFLAEHGDAAAELYLLHDTIRACKTAELFDAHAADLRWDPVDPNELQQLRSARDALLAKYGPVFGTDYGWASLTLSTKGAVGFTHLLGPIKQAKWRALYRWLSEDVHAGPGGLRPMGADGHGHEYLLVGPSNAGLLDPSQFTVLALGLLTATLVRGESRTEITIMLGTFNILIGRCIDAFVQAHERVERMRASPPARRPRTRVKGGGKPQ